MTLIRRTDTCGGEIHSPQPPNQTLPPLVLDIPCGESPSPPYPSGILIESLANVLVLHQQCPPPVLLQSPANHRSLTSVLEPTPRLPKRYLITSSYPLIFGSPPHRILTTGSRPAESLEVRAGLTTSASRRPPYLTCQTESPHPSKSLFLCLRRNQLHRNLSERSCDGRAMRSNLSNLSRASLAWVVENQNLTWESAQPLPHPNGPFPLNHPSML